MKRIRFLLGLSFFVTLLSGCSSFMHGYTSREARNHYLHVDVNGENFGFKRIGYIAGHHGRAVSSLIEEKGYPDYLYETKTDGRDSFIFYYLSEENAYIFVEQSWLAGSAKIVAIRSFTEFERARFGMSARKVSFY